MTKKFFRRPFGDFQCFFVFRPRAPPRASRSQFMLIFVVTWADFLPKAAFLAILDRKSSKNDLPEPSKSRFPRGTYSKSWVWVFLVKSFKHDPPGAPRSSQNGCQNHPGGRLKMLKNGPRTFLEPPRQKQVNFFSPPEAPGTPPSRLKIIRCF